jgi:hypothetical protein
MKKNPTIIEPEATDETKMLPSLKRVNIESLLLMAKYDSVFMNSLMSNRNETLISCGIDFSPAEMMLLKSIPSSRLAKTIDEFSVAGIQKSSLASWKTAAAVLLLVAGIVLTTGCAAKPGSSRCFDPDKRECVVNGWVDEETYRTTAIGEPDKSLTGINLRKKDAKKKAKLNAQYQIIERFRGMQIEGAAGMTDFEKTDFADKPAFKSIIKAGSIIKETYDNNQNCEIIFEIKARNLKKTAESVFQRF